jgi:hypothetical protein
MLRMKDRGKPSGFLEPSAGTDGPGVFFRQTNIFVIIISENAIVITISIQRNTEATTA